MRPAGQAGEKFPVIGFRLSVIGPDKGFPGSALRQDEARFQGLLRNKMRRDMFGIVQGAVKIEDKAGAPNRIYRTSSLNRACRFSSCIRRFTLN
jgi:hypothetical protein